MKWRKENVSFPVHIRKRRRKRDSFVSVQTTGKEELRESGFIGRKSLILNVSSVIGLVWVSWLSAISALFCGSVLSDVQMHCRVTFLFRRFSAAYYEI